MVPQDATTPHIIWLQTCRYGRGLLLSRYPAITDLCTLRNTIPAAAVLLENWDVQSSDWTLVRLTEPVQLQDGSARLVLRIAGTGACVGLGQEITELEEGFQRGLNEHEMIGVEDALAQTSDDEHNERVGNGPLMPRSDNILSRQQ